MTINVHKIMKNHINHRYDDRNAFQVSKHASRLLEEKLKKLIEEITEASLDSLEVGQRIVKSKVNEVVDSNRRMTEIWHNVCNED